MPLHNKKPVRILHIVGGMDTGGIETWLMHVLRRLDRQHCQFDFLAHTTKPCFYDEEIRSLGGRVMSCMSPSRPWQYAENFLRIIKENGPYDVVHSHVHHFSGFVLMLAKQAGVPVRIAHSHNDTSFAERNAGVARRFYLQGSKLLIRRYSTVGLACSKSASINLFGKDWEKDSRWRILSYGLDLTRFLESVDRVRVREELNIPMDAFVLGHVGRFAQQKNHEFILKVFVQVAQRDPKAYLLLVGDGVLRKKIAHEVTRLGLTDRVIFTGVRTDIARLMLGAMDVFVFPSRHEGLGLVVVEAQAAGLPIVMSDAVPQEAIVIPQMIKSLPLLEDVSTWTNAILDCKLLNRANTSSQQSVQNSTFNIVRGLEELKKTYSQERVSSEAVCKE